MSRHFSASGRPQAAEAAGGAPGGGSAGDWGRAPDRVPVGDSGGTDTPRTGRQAVDRAPLSPRSCPAALTVAGSDSGGGAGIQADLKTFQELGVYGMSALTAVTAQNTLGVHGVFPLTPEFVGMQLDSVGGDLPPAAVKTGMLFSGEIIETVADRAARYGWSRLVVDPVMTAKGGARLLQTEAILALKRRLLPLALVVTPNLPEAELLAGFEIRSFADRERAAAAILECGCRYVVLKGGHDETDENRVVDLLYDGSRFLRLESRRIDTRHTHGTGCTFSAALAAELARGASVAEAAGTAKAFVQAAIEDGLGLGGGHGPTNHFAYNRRRRNKEAEEYE